MILKVLLLGFSLICLNTLIAQPTPAAGEKYFAKVPLPQMTDNTDAETIMQEAIAHFDGQRFHKCIELLNHAVEINEYGQLTDILFYYRGIAKYRLELYQEALLDYNRAINTNPQKAHYYYQRAMTAFQLRQYQAAEKDFLKALELGESHENCYLKLGFIQEQKKDIRTALAYYSKAIEINPKRAESYYYRGLLMFQVMMPEKGCQDFQQAANLGLPIAEKRLQEYCNK